MSKKSKSQLWRRFGYLVLINIQILCCPSYFQLSSRVFGYPDETLSLVFDILLPFLTSNAILNWNSLHWTMRPYMYFSIVLVGDFCGVWKVSVCWWFSKGVLTQDSLNFLFWYRYLSFFSFSPSAIQLSLQKAESSKVEHTDLYYA